MEKNIDLFDLCFAQAFKATKWVADFCLLTYEDLRQNCWITFAEVKECTNKDTYAAYITLRLIWAIKDYRSKILKTRIEWVDGKQKSVDRRPHISLDNEKESIELPSTEDADYSGTDIIIKDVLKNGLFTQQQKTYFSLSFVDGMKDVEISERLGVTQPWISALKKQVYSKLINKYAESQSHKGEIK